MSNCYSDHNSDWYCSSDSEEEDPLDKRDYNANKRCTNCIGCKWCEYCSNCTNCEECEHCVDCIGCEFCVDCIGCTNLSDKNGIHNGVKKEDKNNENSTPS